LFHEANINEISLLREFLVTGVSQWLILRNWSIEFLKEFEKMSVATTTPAAMQ